MKSFVFFWITLLSFSMMAQDKLQESIDRFARLPALKNAGVSIAVLDGASGELIASYDPDRLLIPASSLKVVTTASALALLGVDYTFETRLTIDGNIDDAGTLNGNIHIEGGGDPTLGSDKFGDLPLDELMVQWVNAIKAAGIKKINGSVIGDGRFFSGPICGRTWPWEDVGNYYGSGAWGLNIHENLYYIELQQQSGVGSRPQLNTHYPNIPGLILINEIVSAEKGSGDQAYVFGGPYQYTRFIRGTIPVGARPFTIKGSLPDPPLFAAYYLMKKLTAKGIDCSRPPSTAFEMMRTNLKARANKKIIHTHQSLPLSAIVREANMVSNNLYCEAMLKTIGKEKGSTGSTAAGIRVIREFWSGRGLEMDEIFLEDGSGLSPRNGISARQLANFMRIAQREKTFSSFYDSLPIAGKSGTMKRLLAGSPLSGKLRAKSGGMERVRSYTGYTDNRSGKRLVFCIIANNFSGKSVTIRKEMERVMKAMY